MEIVANNKSTGRGFRPSGKPKTVAEFEVWESKRHSDYNYEFYYGEIIKKPAMKQNELILLRYLNEAFLLTGAYRLSGVLASEVDVFVDEDRKRIPDLAFFTDEQVLAAAKGEKVVSAFAIEILSDSETLRHIEKKVQDYFDAGVQLVWYITAKSKRIYAYNAVNEVKIYSAGESVTAAPVLPDFEIDIDKLFFIG
ncbi:MAG: Uma2 family endonuclease [Chitinophagaceae bacterium]